MREMSEAFVRNSPWAALRRRLSADALSLLRSEGIFRDGAAERLVLKDVFLTPVSALFSRFVELHSVHSQWQLTREALPLRLHQNQADRRSFSDDLPLAATPSNFTTQENICGTGILRRTT